MIRFGDEDDTHRCENLTIKRYLSTPNISFSFETQNPATPAYFVLDKYQIVLASEAAIAAHSRLSEPVDEINYF